MLKKLDRLEEVVAFIVLSGTVLAVLVGAIGRAIGRPYPAAPEVAQLLLIWTVMLGADLVMKRGDHIRISAIPDALPHRHPATQAASDGSASRRKSMESHAATLRRR